MEELQTQRGYREPSVVQFSIFLDNRVGRLKTLLQLLDERDISLAAISIIDSVDCAIVRCILTPSDAARDLLAAERISVSETDIVVVELPSADALGPMCECLLKAEVNLHYVYSLLVRPTGQPAVALHVDEPELAANILRASHFVLLGEAELA